MAVENSGGKLIKDDKSLKRKLSPKELSMIFILLIVIIVSLGSYFLLFPKYVSMNALTPEIEDLQMKESEYRNQIAQTELFQQMYDEAAASYNKYVSYFFKPMEPEALDERVTGMLIAHKMTPATLSMSSIAVESIPEYLATELQPHPAPPPVSEEPVTDETWDDAGTAGDATGTGDAAETGEGDLADDAAAGGEPPIDAEPAAPTDYYAFVYTVNVSADGNRDNLYTFLSQVATMTSMEVIRYSFTDSQEQAYNPGAGVAGTGGTAAAGGGSSESTTTPGKINMELKLYVFVEGVPAASASGAY